MKVSTTIALAALAFASAAHAASADYLLEIDGIKTADGKAAQVNSWSFGVCNSGACTSRGKLAPREAGSGMATGKAAYDKCCLPTASQNSQSLRESPTKSSTGVTTMAATPLGDVDGDGSPDLAFAATQEEIYGLELTFQKIPAEYQAACASGHIDKATITNGTETFAVSSVSVVCGKGGAGASTAAYARSGINRIDSTPARISTNFTVARQTQTQSFGEKCQAGMQCGGAAVTMTLSGGKMSYGKTGHVTLMK
ncbi:MAG: hypothetical protein KGM49_03970 [Sphingomonadales bacterium]|nr:hypothetical protein [Sphingomonadales bacterium]